MNIDTIVWWTGASVLGSVGLAGAVALVVGTSVVSAYFAGIYARQFGNIASNLRDIWAWDNAGRPVYELCGDRWDWVHQRTTHN